MGECDKKTTFEILDYFYASGGNFIDTANIYMAGESERWLGEWMADRNVRDQMIIATKYSNPIRALATEPEGNILSNYGGNSKKSLRISLEQSLKYLQTDYVDIFYVHAWEGLCSIEEMMRALDDIVRAGKVLYLGVSNWPAWAVVKANDYARQHGLSTFVVYQGRWNPADRDIEREIIPMCKHEGMGITVWGALGGGKFKSKDSKETDGRTFTGDLGGASLETFQKCGNVMEEIGKTKGCDAMAVALRYVMLKVC
jgi:aryl-alcohol dehydrogenase-like predicted oxidoreductase